MISVSKDWNPKQKLLLELIKKDSTFNEAISLSIDGASGFRVGKQDVSGPHFDY